MSEPTREEFAARIEASEARMEAKLVGIDAKIDRVLDRVEMSVRASEKAETAAERASDRADEARRAASTTKWNIVFTAIGVTTVLLAAFAIWAQGAEMIGTIIGTVLSAKPS